MRFSGWIRAAAFCALALPPAAFLSERAEAQPELGLPDLPPATALDNESPVPAEVPIVPAPPPEVRLEAEAQPNVDLAPAEESSAASEAGDGPDAEAEAPSGSPAVAAETSTANFQIPVQKPEQMYGISNGTFTYRVDLDLPPFHGTEPKLSFAYSSSRGTRIGGENQGWLGVGWVLDGIHVIERASPRLGTPWFGLSGVPADIFVWNGEPLLPCAEQTGPSASCSSGGTHFSKVESYFRFQLNTTSNQWTITDRGGTRYVLKPVNAFNGVNPSDPVELRTQYRWLLANIIDTHNNTVNFVYSCPVAPQCQLSQINYTGTVVEFTYEPRPDVVSYGNGKNLGRSDKRIKWVRVVHGAATQKWFVLKYQQNAVSNLSRLTEIIPYGDDATVGPDGNVAGSTLPKHTFQYNTATTTIYQGPATGLISFRPPAAVDVDGDGRDDLLTIFEACGTSNVITPTYKRLLGDTHPFGISGSQPINFNLACPLDPIAEQRLQPHQVLFGHFNPDKYIDFLYVFVQFHQDESYTYIPYTILSNGSGGWSASSAWPAGSPTSLSDPSVPLLVKDNEDGIDTVGAPTLAGTPLAGSDFDGDGLSDRFFFQDGVIRIRLSSGPVINGPFGQAEMVPFGTLFTDLNGDGLTDITVQGGYPFSELQANQKQVHLSTGSGFESPLVQSIVSSLYGPATADLNGDGRSELVFGEPGSSNPGVPAFATLFNSSDNRLHRPNPTWTLTSYGFYTGVLGSSFGGWVGDFNGDDLTDVIRSSNGAADIPAGPFDNLLTKVFNGYGGVISIEYLPSSKWTNERMPSVQQTVSRITVEDGRGPAVTRQYTYRGGKYDFRERRFLGFARETETLPCIIGEAQCPKISRDLVQELGAIGAVKNETTYNGADQVLRAVDRIYTTNTSDGVPLLPYTTRLTREDTFFYVVPNATPLASTRTTFEYDIYANIVSRKDFGRNGVSGDERVHNAAFLANTSLYIVDRKRGETWRAGHTTSDPILTHSLYYFDGEDDNLAPPIRGDLTAQKHFIQPQQYTPLEHFTYDTFGNRTSYRDAVNNLTQWEWDSTYRLYLVKETNAKGQFKTWTRNFHCEQPATETDLNGLVTVFTYDAFCRVTQAARAVTGNTITHTYLDFGNPSTQRVRVSRPHPNGGGNQVHDVQWFDGLGRIWQETKPSSGPTIIVERAFDARGNKQRETFPYYAGESAYNTAFRYDGMNRTILQTNPDGTTKSFAYNVDPRDTPIFGNAIPLESALTIDELGRPTTIVTDAYGRQVESTRVLLGPPVTSVVEQRRHDPLGRLLGVRDPGGSQWALHL